jgi:16S rRNA G966 N2-methylase RsmD
MNPAALVARWDRVKRAVGRTIALEAFSRGELAVIAIELERCAKRRLRTAILHRQQQRRSRVVDLDTVPSTSAATREAPGAQTGSEW